ncbi:MAG: hypothetical protein IJO75_04270 [Clostridia bacterium]|nr:hypothetical protein [Clostridia bacterium]
MDKKESYDIITSCNKKFNISLAVALIISFFILFFNTNAIFKILFSVCFFFAIAFIASTVIKSKYINPILNNELNPQKYYTVICGTHNATKYAIDEMLVSYFMRDYNAVINICNLKLKDKKIRNYKYFYIQYLARTYFDLGDYENLKATCEKFESELSEVKNLKSAKKIRNAFGNPIKYYDSYLSADFKACKEQYKRLIDDSILLNNKLQKIAAYYLYAIACYKLGDFEEAKAYFTVIVNEAPLLCYCEIAKNYIHAIDNNQEFDLEKRSIEINPNYEIPQGKAVMPDKRGAVIGIIAIILLAVIICIVSVNVAPSTPEKALKNNEGMTELIFTYEANKEKDLFCFYNTKRDGLSVAFLECTGEDKYKVGVTLDGISFGSKGEIGVAKRDLIIEFAVYDNIYDIPTNNLGVKEFSAEEGTAYFCITSVRNENVTFSHTSYSSLSQYEEIISMFENS